MSDTAIVLYYVVGYDDDTRHATRHNPRNTGDPHRPVPTLCGRTLHAALPGDDRKPPNSVLPGGANPFCDTCVLRDACLPGTIHRVLTTENWRMHTPVDRRPFR